MGFEILGHGGVIDTSSPELAFSTLQLFMDLQPALMFIKDNNLVYRACTKSFAEMTGHTSAAEIIGKTDFDIFEDEAFARRYVEDDRRLLASGKDLIDYVEPITDKDGEARYSSTSKYILTNTDGGVIGLLGIGRDVTSAIKAKQQYVQEVEYLFTLPPDTYSAILIDVTDWRIIGQRRQMIQGRMSPEYTTIESLVAAAQEGLGDEEGGNARKFYQEFSKEFLTELYNSGKSSFTLEYPRKTPDGSLRWTCNDLKFIPNPENGHLGLMLIVRSIDEQKQAEHRIIQAASTDELTGLLNRATARRKITDYLAEDGRDGSHAIFMIDIDNFKSVNDLFGHQEGDSLLISIAGGIETCFRDSDLIARLGGDEFFVLAKNMPSRSSVQKRAEHLLRVIRDVHAADTSAIISVSIGISMYPEDGTTLDELYAKADEALYKAKRLGKNQAAFASGEQYLFSGGEAAMRYEDYNSLVVDHSSSICYVSDPVTYDLLHLTKAGLEVCGLTSPEEYKGKKCYEVLQGRKEPCPFCTNSKLIEGQDYRWEHYNESLGRWFDITDSLLLINGRQCRMEIARDITGRKGGISLSSGELSMEDVLFRCLHILTTETDLNRAFGQFLEGIGGYYHSNRSYIFEFDFDRQTLSNSYEWCAPGVTAEIDNLQDLPLEVVDGWVRKFKSSGEFSINSLHDDIDPDSDEYQILEAQGIQSLMAAPLLRGDEIVGFIGVDDPRANLGDLTLLRSVSEFVRAELERRRLLAELEHMSFTDTLTGLKNRNQYDRILREYQQRTPESLGVVYVDINGMKGINDAHGHSYGDHVIKRTGLIAAENLSGTVYRTGGDEFVALIEDISKEDFQREIIALRSAFELEPECNVSIGSAWREREEDTASLLQQAGELLAADKQSYYHAVLRSGRDETIFTGIASEVSKEIEDRRFVVYYQPQVDIQTGKVIGAEALVRKLNDDGSVIPPTKFIPFYEAEGVVDLVDLFVLQSACKTMRTWLDMGHSLHMSVNFSRVTLLAADIVEVISGICREYGVPTSAITIEVTESISKMDNDQLRELIEKINAAGFTISLDDFGSKYSNLAILASMDFDEIKFDKSLVETLEKNPKSRIVMENTVKMCRDLQGTTSLAEGVETKGQLDLLMDYQCDYGQGYYFSKPVPAEEFGALLSVTLGENK